MALWLGIRRGNGLGYFSKVRVKFTGCCGAELHHQVVGGQQRMWQNWHWEWEQRAKRRRNLGVCFEIWGFFGYFFLHTLSILQIFKSLTKLHAYCEILDKMIKLDKFLGSNKNFNQIIISYIGISVKNKIRKYFQRRTKVYHLFLRRFFNKHEWTNFFSSCIHDFKASISHVKPNRPFCSVWPIFSWSKHKFEI